MAKTDFPLSINRRQLLATGVAVVGILPVVRRAEPAGPDFVQLPQVTPEAEPTNVSAATASAAG
jgi:hypothetical protein